MCTSCSTKGNFVKYNNEINIFDFYVQVWDDKYLSNADFAFIYPFFVTEEINRLEQKFLELIQ